jgi:hypothetical protein
VLFGSGDVGGARALLPVIQLCAAQGLEFACLGHGHLPSEASSQWPLLDIPDDCSTQEAATLVADWNPQVYVFATSVHSRVALRVAWACRERSIPALHVLDHWSSYSERLEDKSGAASGPSLFVPDIYAVMDGHARDEAAAEGIPTEVLRVTGHPALVPGIEPLGWASGVSPGAGRLLFVSEPVRSDHGLSRGYTEDDVLRAVCQVLQPLAAEMRLGILPHPREDAGALEEIWNRARGALLGDVLSVARGSEALPGAVGVIGMASMLLYEAWLRGIPVASVQPGLRKASLKLFRRCDGVLCIEDGAYLDRLPSWVQGAQNRPPPSLKPEVAFHTGAAARILGIIRELVAQRRQKGMVF